MGHIQRQSQRHQSLELSVTPKPIGSDVQATSGTIPVLGGAVWAVLILIAQEAGALVDKAGRAAGLLSTTAMPEVSVSFPLRRATSGSVHPAHAIAANGRCTTKLSCSLSF